MKKLIFLSMTFLAFILTSGSADVHRKIDRDNANSLIATAEDKDCGMKSLHISAARAWGSNALRADVLYELSIALKKDKDANVRISAARALESIGFRAGKAVNALFYALETDKDPNVRSSAASALGSLRPIEVGIVKKLIDTLKWDEHPNVRSSAASALGSIWHEIREY